MGPTEAESIFGKSCFSIFLSTQCPCPLLSFLQEPNNMATKSLLDIHMPTMYNKAKKKDPINKEIEEKERLPYANVLYKPIN